MLSDFGYVLLSNLEVAENPDKYAGRKMIIVSNAPQRKGYDIRHIRFNPKYHLPLPEETKIYLIIN